LKKLKELKKPKKWEKWEWIRVIILIFVSIGIIYSTINIISYIIEGKNNKELNQEIIQQVKVIDENEIKKKKIDILKKINEDALGWIKIEDTNVDYLLVQANNNEYFLSHNIENEESSRGSIFLDYKNRKDDKNILIYGHNMKDGDMFGELDLYDKKTYYEEHSIINLTLFGETVSWKIYSVYYLDDSLLKIYFENEEKFILYLEEIKNKSIYDTGVDINSANNIISLSPCSKVFGQARLVICAVKIE
jgi:sortase B